MPAPKGNQYAIGNSGRPSTYNPDIIPELLDLASKGKSLAQISAKLNIPRTTMISWGDVHPEFSTVLTRAKELEQSWWEDTGQKALTADKFNSAVWSKSMSSRFRNEYTEKREHEHTGPNRGPVEISQTVKKLSDMTISELNKAFENSRAIESKNELPAQPDLPGDGTTQTGDE
ncbi:MAG: hypothetical protein GY943_18810 [Chloroflexi bacterium]|nr:hypothetical protein [Chloroflexota bacterium]